MKGLQPPWGPPGACAAAVTGLLPLHQAARQWAWRLGPHLTGCHEKASAVNFTPLLSLLKMARVWKAPHGSLCPFLCLSLKTWLCEGCPLAFPNALVHMFISPEPMSRGLHYLVSSCGVLTKQDLNLDLVHFLAYCQEHLSFAS